MCYFLEETVGGFEEVAADQNQAVLRRLKRVAKRPYVSHDLSL